MKKNAKIIIAGNKDYISYMSKHLKKEHPATRKRMKVFGVKTK